MHWCHKILKHWTARSWLNVWFQEKRRGKGAKMYNRSPVIPTCSGSNFIIHSYGNTCNAWLLQVYLLLGWNIELCHNEKKLKIIKFCNIHKLIIYCFSRWLEIAQAKDKCVTQYGVRDLFMAVPTLYPSSESWIPNLRWHKYSQLKKHSFKQNESLQNDNILNMFYIRSNVCNAQFGACDKPGS